MLCRCWTIYLLKSVCDFVLCVYYCVIYVDVVAWPAVASGRRRFIYMSYRTVFAVQWALTAFMFLLSVLDGLPLVSSVCAKLF